MLDVVVATTNPHKFKELRQLLPIAGIRWHSLAELPQFPKVREDGQTFDANAIKKAVALSRATDWFSLADDSGIEVEALGGKPGIYSARFAGKHGNDRANNEKLLRLLNRAGVASRRACYRCSLALAGPSGFLRLTRGIWKGSIAREPRGEKGFGYDPIFFVRRYGKTVGQLPASLKAKLSHRAVAARKMRPILQRLAAEVNGRNQRRSETTPRGSARRSAA